MSIATEIARLQNAKASLKTAIESKGITVPDSTLLNEYAELVDDIETGGGGTGETVTIATAYTNPVALFEAVVSTLSANTVYMLFPIRISEPTQNNQLFTLTIFTGQNGTIISTGYEGIRFRDNTYRAFNYNSSYTISTTIGDQYLLVMYDIG